jgi:hypothetical protein
VGQPQSLGNQRATTENIGLDSHKPAEQHPGPVTIGTKPRAIQSTIFGCRRRRQRLPNRDQRTLWKAN